MLQLVRYQMGADKERLLREAYVKHGVKYRAKRKLSPATLAKMRERGKQLAKQHFHKEGQ